MAGWKRPLVVGASGQVGTALAAALHRRGDSGPVCRSSRQPMPGWLQFDLADLAHGSEPSAVLGDASPDLILCTGGMTYVDGCEQAPAAASAANAQGPAVLASYAHSRAIPFVFFSTDYVFPGSAENAGPYAEDAALDPLSVYGRSKLEGERLVTKAHPHALIVRTTVVYGPDLAAKNFLYTLLRSLKTGAPLRVAADQVSTPTYNRDLAEGVLALLDAGVSGVVHIAGAEVMDRVAFAREVASFFELDDSGIEGVSTASLGQVAARPLLSGLKTQRLEQLGPSLRRHAVREALRDCEEELRRFLARC